MNGELQKHICEHNLPLGSHALVADTRRQQTACNMSMPCSLVALASATIMHLYLRLKNVNCLKKIVDEKTDSQLRSPL